MQLTKMSINFRGLNHEHKLTEFFISQRRNRRTTSEADTHLLKSVVHRVNIWRKIRKMNVACTLQNQNFQQSVHVTLLFLKIPVRS